MMKQAASTSAPICLKELDRGLRRAAGGDEIVDQDDALALRHGVLVHFHFVDAVFERIADGHALERQLALLADRHEAAGHLMRDGAAEDKAARLDAGDLVDLAAGPRLHQFVDRAPERPRIAQQRGDIAKHDARLRIIRNGTDRSLEVVLERGADHDWGRTTFIQC